MAIIPTNQDWIYQLYMKEFHTPKLEPEDFYYNDDGKLVLTEEYHKKRGYCCDNGCKHCPFKQK
jgi:hypothetical protein